MKNQKRYYMDEDDFKQTSLPALENLVPKSFVSEEKKLKKKFQKALKEIEKISLSIGESNDLNVYSSAINNIMYVIKNVDISKDI